MIIKIVVWLFALIGIYAAVFVGVGMIDDVRSNITESNRTMWETFDKCCEGKPCTDTYYDPEEKVCRLTRCPFNIDYCTYPPSE